MDLKLQIYLFCLQFAYLIMASNTQGSPMKALIVEDVQIHILILTTLLGRFNCETTVAKNGKEAVDLFLEGKKFDIVFCDKDMPVMTGPEVLKLFPHFCMKNTYFVLIKYY